MKPNWNEAPDGAEFYASGLYWFNCGGGFAVDRPLSHNKIYIMVRKDEAKKQYPDYCERPKDIDNLNIDKVVSMNEVHGDETKTLKMARGNEPKNESFERQKIFISYDMMLAFAIGLFAGYVSWGL